MNVVFPFNINILSLTPLELKLVDFSKRNQSSIQSTMAKKI